VKTTTTTTDINNPLTPIYRLKSLTLRELMEMKFAPKEPLIAPWFYTGQSAMIWSEPGVGKTWFCLTLALMMAGGGSAFGWTSPKPRRVLLVDGEMTVQDITARLALLAPMAIEGLNLDVAMGNLEVLSRHHQNAEWDFIDIANKETHNVLLSRIRDRHKAEAVIFDNFTTLSDSITDENSNGQMRTVCTMLAKLKSTGIASVLVHHSGKNGETFRGASTLATTFEVIAGLKKTTQAEIEQSCQFELVFTKTRERGSDATQPRKFRLVHNLGFGIEGVANEGTPSVIWETEATEGILEKKCIAALESFRFLDQKSLAAHLGIEPYALSKLKRHMDVTGLYPIEKFNKCLKAARDEEEGVDLENPF
jgi:hypothetical protein